METLPVGINSDVLLTRHNMPKAEPTLKSVNTQIGTTLSAEEISTDPRLVYATPLSIQLSIVGYEQGNDTYLKFFLAQQSLYTSQQPLISINLTQATNLVTIYEMLGGDTEITK